MPDIYNDNTYLTNNPGWHEEDAAFKAGKIYQLLQQHTITAASVAEAGCGSGEILVQLAKKLQDGTKFFGFDISAAAIEIAQKKATGNIQFELKDIADKTYKSHFDLLLVIDVIEHIENYFTFLDGIRHRSKYTVFHIPLDMSAWSLFREQMLIESKNRVGHIHNFTEGFIKSILRDRGFEIIGQLYTEPTFETYPFKQKVINTVRKILFRINKKFCTKTLGGYSILLLTKANRQEKS